MAEQYDLVVIGAGPGGYIAAIRAGQLGMKVACVEKRATLGGTCLNVGCIPSKALLQSSELYAEVSGGLTKHGIEVENVKLNLGAMMKRKDAVVRQLTNGIGSLFKKNKVEWVVGAARIKSATEVEVTGAEGAKLLSTKRILVATGSEPSSVPGLVFDGKRIVSSDEAIAFSEVPKHLVVVGGGVIGLELGSVWARLGSKVTVVEFLDRLVPTLDKEISSEIKKILMKQGLDFKLSTKVTAAKVGADGVSVDLESVADSAKETLKADMVLVATGRRAYTENLGLKELGVKQDKAGRIEIDAHFQSNVPGIFAVGDVVAGPMLAHKAEEEGVICVELMAGQKSHMSYDTIPGIVYTWPEIGAVGITEEEAKAKNIAVKIGKVPFMANARAKCADDTDGFAKVIADAKTDRLLGVHIIGPQASELIAEAVTIMEFGGSAEDLGTIIHGHPTLTETVKDAALAVHKRSLNF